MTGPTDPLGGLRPVRDDDAARLAALIGGVFAEYPGCVLDLDGVDADLRHKATEVAAHGGEFWVLERDDDRLDACIGYVPCEVDGAAGIELTRLYVAAVARRRGLGRALVERVEAAARTRGASIVELWSDSRFADAHRLYDRLGYARTRETRQLDDPSQTTELRFVKHLGA